MKTPHSDAREDPITEDLCRCLRQNRNSRDLPFQIQIQLVELDPAAGEDQGRMDIVFVPMVNREDIYFCLECKRLNVVKDGKVRPYTSEYLTHGMLRFINGPYAARVSQGGMLGYVLDGNVAEAIRNVDGLMQKRHRELGMNPPGKFASSSILSSDFRVKETMHSRPGNLDNFTIHHVFAPAV